MGRKNLEDGSGANVEALITSTGNLEMASFEWMARTLLTDTTVVSDMSRVRWDVMELAASTASLRWRTLSEFVPSIRRMFSVTRVERSFVASPPVQPALPQRAKLVTHASRRSL